MEWYCSECKRYYNLDTEEINNCVCGSKSFTILQPYLKRGIR